MKPSDVLATCVGGAAFWMIWVASSAASRQVGTAQTYRQAHGASVSAAAPWKSKGNLVFAAALGAGVVAMRELTNFRLLQVLGLWLLVMAYPAAYKYAEGAGDGGRVAGFIRAIGLLAATLTVVVVVYTLLGTTIG